MNVNENNSDDSRVSAGLKTTKKQQSSSAMLKQSTSKSESKSKIIVQKTGNNHVRATHAALTTRSNNSNSNSISINNNNNNEKQEQKSLRLQPQRRTKTKTDTNKSDAPTGAAVVASPAAATSTSNKRDSFSATTTTATKTTAAATQKCPTNNNNSKNGGSSYTPKMKAIEARKLKDQQSLATATATSATSNNNKITTKTISRGGGATKNAKVSPASAAAAATGSGLWWSLQPAPSLSASQNNKINDDNDNDNTLSSKSVAQRPTKSAHSSPSSSPNAPLSVANTSNDNPTSNDAEISDQEKSRTTFARSVDNFAQPSPPWPASTPNQNNLPSSNNNFINGEPKSPLSLDRSSQDADLPSPATQQTTSTSSTNAHSGPGLLPSLKALSSSSLQGNRKRTSIKVDNLSQILSGFEASYEADDTPIQFEAALSSSLSDFNYNHNQNQTSKTGKLVRAASLGSEAISDILSSEAPTAAPRVTAKTPRTLTRAVSLGSTSFTASPKPFVNLEENDTCAPPSPGRGTEATPGSLHTCSVTQQTTEATHYPKECHLLKDNSAQSRSTSNSPAHSDTKLARPRIFQRDSMPELQASCASKPQESNDSDAVPDQQGQSDGESVHSYLSSDFSQFSAPSVVQYAGEDSQETRRGAQETRNIPAPTRTLPAVSPAAAANNDIVSPTPGISSSSHFASNVDDPQTSAPQEKSETILPSLPIIQTVVHEENNNGEDNYSGNANESNQETYEQDLKLPALKEAPRQTLQTKNTIGFPASRSRSRSFDFSTDDSSTSTFHGGSDSDESNNKKMPAITHRKADPRLLRAASESYLYASTQQGNWRLASSTSVARLPTHFSDDDDDDDDTTDTSQPQNRQAVVTLKTNSDHDEANDVFPVDMKFPKFDSLKYRYPSHTASFSKPNFTRTSSESNLSAASSYYRAMSRLKPPPRGKGIPKHVGLNPGSYEMSKRETVARMNAPPKFDRSKSEANLMAPRDPANWTPGSVSNDYYSNTLNNKRTSLDESSNSPNMSLFAKNKHYKKKVSFDEVSETPSDCTSVDTFACDESKSSKSSSAKKFFFRSKSSRKLIQEPSQRRSRLSRAASESNLSLQSNLKPPPPQTTSTLKRSGVPIPIDSNANEGTSSISFVDSKVTAPPKLAAVRSGPILLPSNQKRASTKVENLSDMLSQHGPSPDVPMGGVDLIEGSFSFGGLSDKNNKLAPLNRSWPRRLVRGGPSARRLSRARSQLQHECSSWSVDVNNDGSPVCDNDVENQASGQNVVATVAVAAAAAQRERFANSRRNSRGRRSFERSHSSFSTTVASSSSNNNEEAIINNDQSQTVEAVPPPEPTTADTSTADVPPALNNPLSRSASQGGVVRALSNSSLRPSGGSSFTESGDMAIKQRAASLGLFPPAAPSPQLNRSTSSVSEPVPPVRPGAFSVTGRPLSKSVESDEFRIDGSTYERNSFLSRCVDSAASGGSFGPEIGEGYSLPSSSGHSSPSGGLAQHNLSNHHHSHHKQIPVLPHSKLVGVAFSQATTPSLVYEQVSDPKVSPPHLAQQHHQQQLDQHKQMKRKPKLKTNDSQYELIEAHLVEDPVRQSPRINLNSDDELRFHSSAEFTLAEATPLGAEHNMRSLVVNRKFLFGCSCIVGVMLLGALTGIAVAVTRLSRKNGESFQPSTLLSHAPSMAPTVAFDIDLGYFQRVVLDDQMRSALADPQSPQSSALDWLRSDPNFISYPTWRRAQRYALATFYYSTTSIQGWTDETGWLTKKHECEWFSSTDLEGPVCVDGKYYVLSLRKNGLKGTIPPEIGLLTDLDSFEVDGNAIAGTIPEQIGNLSALKQFSCFDNLLFGSLPSRVGEMSQLQSFLGSNNNLGHALPTMLGKLTSLKTLNLAENFISGTIPPEFGTMSQLETLYLRHNLLSGPIPPQFGNLTQLLEIDLDSNNLSGSIPSKIGNLNNLKIFNVASNALSGGLVPDIGDLKSLLHINLSNNNLGGTLPKEIGHLEKLVTINIQGNMFSGGLPPELASLRRSLEVLVGTSNNFSGSIPSEIGFLTKLMVLDLADNSFDGVLPAELSLLTSITMVDLSANSFQGSVPQEWSVLTNLSQLSLHTNPFLSGDVPESVCTSLDELTSKKFVVDCDLLQCDCCTCHQN